MADGQVKFTLTDDARGYLRWLGAEVLFLKTEHDVAKYLVTRQIEILRRENKGRDPSTADIRATFPIHKSEESD